jgi:calcineurin-like phosphoesterase family protein
MPETWFTSDLHLGHMKVANLRGFDDPQDHDLALIANWSRRVQSDDVVYVLGDLSSGSSRATLDALALLQRLPGVKRLIAGNHDPIHPMHRQAHNWAWRFNEVFEFTAPFQRLRLYGHEVMLSHFPYKVDRAEPRYMQYRLRDEGLPLLHGHLHSEYASTSHREAHVGVDAWGLAPVTGHTLMRDVLGFQC